MKLFGKNVRLDGWSNLLSGIGTKRDKSTANTFTAGGVLPLAQLSDMWNGEGLGARIVIAPVEDMLRQGISIQNDTDGKLEKECKRLKLSQVMHEALQWQRLYGGSIIVIGDSDGDLDTEVKADSKIPIKFLKVYPRTRIEIMSTDLIMNPDSPYFEQVSQYNVLRLDGQYLRVHRSRCIEFSGPSFAYPGTGVSWNDAYWGMSCLQQIWDKVTTLGISFQAAANLLQEYNIGVFKLSNLAELIATGNEKLVQDRIEIISTSKSVINSVLIGENEEFRRDTASLTGVDSVIDRHMMLVSGVSAIPVTRLFGKSAAGMNATGENDMKQYYDKVQSEQEQVLQPPLQLLLDRMNRYLGNGKTVVFTFNPLWTPTQQEQVGMASTQAATDEKYINLGVLTAEEVRDQRFVGGYNFSTSIEEGTPMPPPPAEAPTAPAKTEPTAMPKPVDLSKAKSNPERL